MVARNASWTAEASSRVDESEIPEMTEARGELRKASLMRGLVVRMVLSWVAAAWLTRSGVLEP
jgi:hypothetical protein